MFTLLRLCGAQVLMFVQLPSFLVAFVVAELFYKFHSFTLETAAFLATWFVLDLVMTGFVRLVRKNDAQSAK